jgi:hypothetical protein
LVKFCKECKWSRPETHSEWRLKCVHPEINSRDSWALARGSGDVGSDAQRERSNTSWFAKCGMKGKLWESNNGS